MSLHFEITGNNEDLKRKLEESRKAILDSGKTAEEQSAKIEKAFQSMSKGLTPINPHSNPIKTQFTDLVAEAKNASTVVVDQMQKIAKGVDVANLPIEKSIDVLKTFIIEQKKYLAETENNIKSLGKLRTEAAPGQAEQNISKQLVAAKKDYQEQKTLIESHSKDLNKLQDQYRNTTEATESLYTQRRKLREEMASLANSDGTVSPQNLVKYDELKKKYIEVETAVRRVNNERKLLASEGSAQIAGIINGIQGFAGAFTAAQGVMSLFVDDNEKLAKIQKNLQAAMSITIGLQAVANTLSATSSFRMKTATTIQAGYTTALNATSRAFVKMGMSARAAGISAKVAWAAATLGISLLIAAAIEAYDRFKSLGTIQKRLNKSTEEYNKSIITESANINRLFVNLKKAKEGTKAYQKARDEIQSKYGSYLDGLSKEIRLLQDQEGAFKAISAAAIQAAKDKAIASGTEDAAGAYAKTWGENIKKARKAFSKAGVENINEVIQDISSAIDAGTIRTWYNKGAQIDGVSEAVKVAFEKVRENGGWDAAGLNPAMTEIISARNEYTKEIRELNALFGSSGDEDEKLEIKNKEHWTNIKDTAEKAKAALDSSMKGGEDWLKYEKIIADAQKELDKYSSSYATDNKIQSSAYERQRDADRRRIDQIQDAVELEIKTREENINQLDDSFAKEEQMRQLNYDKEFYDVLKQQERMLRAQQDAEYDEWKKKNPNYQKQGLVFTPATKTASQLPDSQKKQLEGEFNLAYSKNEGAEKDSLKRLLDSYQNYDMQRLELEKRFNNDMAELRRQREEAQAKGNTMLAEQIDRALVQATANKGKELISFDLDLLKKSPEYVRAFEDLKNTSTETLNSLLTQLDEMKFKAAETMNPDDTREYTSTIQSIIDELVERDPFKALANSQNELVKANKALVQAKKNLKQAESSGNQEEINKATKEYKQALDGVRKASNNVIKAQKEVTEQMTELFDSFSSVGDAIGGTAGEIIGFISDIGAFVITSMEGIKLMSKTAAEELKAVEKASVILTIIGAAIQLMQKLGEILPSAEDQYEKYAAKITEINKLTDAVNEYEIAITKARHAEENWFSEDGMRSLKQAKELHEEVASAYFDKLTEEQAIYQNKSGAGWFTKFADFTTIGLGDLFKNMPGWAKALTSDPWSGALSQYNKGTTAAVNNLRIETRKRSKGFLGSGIGGKSQKTEDLTTWMKNNLGYDLFDESGLLNLDAANTVLDKYGDKLVGETKATLEALVELREQYDEYLETLHEYVSSLYEPLVDNFVDSLWDWFDEGKDALDSFKDYASQTFRDIVSDMMRTIILDKVVAGFGDDINALYEKYATGSLGEQDLMDAIADRTSALISDYEQNIPTLQNIMSQLTSSLEGIGLDLRDTEGKTSQEATRRGFETMSQDTASELNGRFTALQMSGINIEKLTGMIQMDVSELRRIGMSSNEALLDLRDIGLDSVFYLEKISKNTSQLYIMNEKLEKVVKNTEGLSR